MKAIYNGEMLDLDAIFIQTDDRGFRYGDGLFETIAIAKNKPRLLEKHHARLLRGAELFGYSKEQLSLEKISEECTELIQANNIQEHGKIRLSIWRRGKGLYPPPGAELNYLITAQPLDSFPAKELILVDFCENVTNYATRYSAFKTISALKYILAGLEKNEKGLDEIIINDQNGHVSESLDSNIFIKKNGIYYTPPVSTGCIEGIMRNWLIDALTSKGIPVEEKCFEPEEMLKADAVFTTNALGLKHIPRIGKAGFDNDTFIQDLIDSIS